MKVQLEKNLLDYMHDHHKHVIALRLLHDYYSGYSANSKYPKIRFKKPRHDDDYEMYTVDDITVYVEKDIPTLDGQITFSDERHLGFHSCHVEGLDIKMLNDTAWNGNYYSADD